MCVTAISELRQCYGLDVVIIWCSCFGRQVEQNLRNLLICGMSQFMPLFSSGIAYGMKYVMKIHKR